MRNRPAPKTIRPARVKKYPAPTRGWVANINLATPVSDGAEVMENWFPTATGARLRRGSARHATLPASAPVETMFSYSNGASKKLFVASAAAIYDITTPASPTGAGAAVVASLTSGAWSSSQFATTGGVFLRLVNGADTSLVYDGASFSTSPAITGVASSALSYVWAFKNRLWFIQGGTMDAWYLAADQIGGAATKFPLGGVFQLGGQLVFGASWSLNENSGLSASCIFVTSEGEVAVYQGSDPNTATDWRLSGVYRIGRPLGPDAFIRAGGDLVIATELGFVPLSQAIEKDVAALALGAVSYNIETKWNDAVERGQGDWKAVLWPREQMAIVSPPSNYTKRGDIFVSNARTGAWCLFTGWKVTALHVFDGRCFYGGTDGRITEIERTGGDEDLTYSGAIVPLFDDLRLPTQIKSAKMARYILKAAEEPEVTVSTEFDYILRLPTPPSVIALSDTNVWGIGIWGQMRWGSERVNKVFQRWQSVGGSGYAMAPAVQVSSGGLIPPDIELVAIDVLYEVGDIGS